MPPLPRISVCPNCFFSYRELGMFSSAEVAKCKECGQVMCVNCCKNSVWSGYICQKCGSRRLETIGRIKDPFGVPTFSEDLRDGEAFKSYLSPGTLRIWAVLAVGAGWFVDLYPLWLKVATTVLGIIILLSAEKISRHKS